MCHMCADLDIAAVDDRLVMGKSELSLFSIYEYAAMSKFLDKFIDICNT